MKSLIARTQEVGKLSAELAISAGITGPGLRAPGVNYDIRKVDGYGIYPRFKFRVPLGEHGDCLRSPDDARARVAREPRRFYTRRWTNCPRVRS